MKYTPDFSYFNRLSKSYEAIPVIRRLLSDRWTPVSAFRQIDRGEAGCLFESVVGGEKVGRYSFLATGPHRTITAKRNQVVITEGDQVHQFAAENPLLEVRKLLKAVKVAPIPNAPPFTGGVVGYAGYDVIRYVEHLPNAPVDDRGLDDLSFSCFDTMLVFDHITKTLSVISLAWPGRHPNSAAAYQEAVDKIDHVVDLLNQPIVESRRDDIVSPQGSLPEFQSNFTQTEFESAVRSCREYIRAGDIFQVVISQRFQMPIKVEPFEIYRSLRVLNPSPFMFFLRTAQSTLVGSSPEIMCRVIDNQVTVRPLAGTRPRGKTDEEDRQLERELLADEKERAEHVMLVDLGRNDVGRIARYGSIELPDLMVVERYSHVMHISSTVNGQLRDEYDAFDALLASLPAGTVSGAPKVRAMQIIDELEPHRRGPYAGAVGYIDYSGNMDTCIALRTMVIKDDIAYVQAGAGVVADSDPASEYQETLNKAMGLLRAIQMTEAR